MQGVTQGTIADKSGGCTTLPDLVLKGVDKLLVSLHGVHITDKGSGANKELGTGGAIVHSRRIRVNHVGGKGLIMAWNVVSGKRGPFSTTWGWCLWECGQAEWCTQRCTWWCQWAANQRMGASGRSQEHEWWPVIPELGKEWASQGAVPRQSDGHQWWWWRTSSLH